MKNSFLLHCDSLAVLDSLTDEQAGKLFKAMAAYHATGEVPEDLLMKLAIMPFINQWKRDLIQFEKVCERNRLNGQKGGRPKNPVGNLETQRNPTKPKKAEKESDSDKENDNDKENDKKKSTRITYPALDEVITFFTENGYTRDIAVKAYHYYAEAGWKDSRGEPVRAWKQKMRGVWFKDENKQPQAPVLSSHYNPAAGDVPAVWQPYDEYRPA